MNTLQAAGGVLAALFLAGCGSSTDTVSSSTAPPSRQLATITVNNGTATITLGAKAMPATAGTSDFLAATALVHSANGAGLRPAYVDAQYNAATIVKQYESRVVPVYVASEVKPYYSTTLATQIPNTTSFDSSATGYSCKSGATLIFDAKGNPLCGGGAHYACYGNASVVTLANGRTGCSDGSIASFIAAETPAYTAPAIKPYTATIIGGYAADTIVGSPAAGTPQMYTATTLHVFTDAERAAMMAADRAAGDLAASKVAGMPLNQAQLDAYRMINNAIFVASGNFVYR